VIRATVRAQTNEELEGLVYGLALQNLAQMRARGGSIPRLYESGVRYALEPRGSDHWQSCIEALHLGELDCEDAAAWLVAEKIYRAERGLPGGDAKAWPRIRFTGPLMRHVTVVMGDGTIEDPSRKLGM
jgi:hypothetical protein